MIPPAEDFDRLVEALRLLGHPLRLALLAQLAQGEKAVGDLATGTGQSLSLISQQLALLRKAGLVQPRRAVKQVFYSLAADRMGEIASALAAMAGTPLAEVKPAPGQTHRITAAVFARVEPRG